MSRLLRQGGDFDLHELRMPSQVPRPVPAKNAGTRTGQPLDFGFYSERMGQPPMLVSGIPVELGRFDANLDWRYVHHPAWKQIVIDNLGAAFADECFRNTPGHRICDVRVEEHAVLPLWNQQDIDDENEDEENDE